MKFILTILTAGTLFLTSGCVVVHDLPDHDGQDDGAHGGVDHGEYPGDMEHGGTMQK